MNETDRPSRTWPRWRQLVLTVVATNWARRRVLALLLVATLCMLIGGGAVILGAHDAVLASRTVDRLLGGIVGLTGLALLLGASLIPVSMTVEDVDARHRLWDLALVGLIVGVFPGLVLCLVQVTANSYSWRLILWLGAVVVPLLGATLLVVSGARPKAMRQVVSASVVTALLVAALPLIGGAFKVVADAAIPDVELESTVIGHRDDGAGNPVAVVDSTLTIRNISKRRLVVVGSIYTLYGSVSQLRDPTADSEDPATLTQELQASGWSGRHELTSAQHLIEGDLDVFMPGHILEPGQHSVRHLVTPVPLAVVNLAEAVATVITGFGDSVRLGGQRHHFTEDPPLVMNKQPLYSMWDLEPSGYLEAVAIEPRQLTVEYWLQKDDTTTPTPSTFMLRMGLEGKLDDEPWYRAFNFQTEQRTMGKLGLGTTSSSRFMFLPPPQ